MFSPAEQNIFLLNMAIENYENSAPYEVESIARYKDMLCQQAPLLQEKQKESYSNILVKWAMQGDAFVGCEALLAYTQCMKEEQFVSVYGHKSYDTYEMLEQQATNPTVRLEAGKTLRYGLPEYRYRKTGNSPS